MADDVLKDGEALLENLNPTVLEGTAPPESLVEEPPVPAEGLAGPISDLDPAKVAEMLERLAEFKKSGTKTISGSEGEATPEFDLTQFEVDHELEHLYVRSKLEQTDEGPKWVVMEQQYLIQTGPWHMHNGGAPKGKDKFGRMQYVAKGLDQIMNDVVNGPEGMFTRERGWKLSALLPGMGGTGIAVFERIVKRLLPDPKLIVKAEEQPLEDTTDEELVRLNEKAKVWTGEEAPVQGEDASMAGNKTLDDGEGEPEKSPSGSPGVSDVVTEESGHVTTEGGQ